jgi:DNA-binding beta-propeller fold protein YncE
MERLFQGAGPFSECTEYIDTCANWGNPMNAPRIRKWSWLAAAVPSTALCAMVVVLSTAQAGEPSLKLIQTIELQGKAGKLDHLVVDSKGQRLFLANKVNSTLDIVDLARGKLLKQVTGQGGAQGVAYAADLDRIYVALGTGGFCNIFDAKNYKLLKTVKFTDDADNIRYNARSHRVYVAHAENALGVIDAKTFEIRADIKLPGPAEAFQLESTRPRLYLNAPSSSEVTVIDTDKNEIAGRHKLTLAGGNYGMALDETNHRLFIGCRTKPMIVIMDTDSGKEITSVAIPADTDDVFYDAKRKRIYASCGEGSIAVIRQIDADHYESLEKIATVKDARTSYFDQETGRLYLGVPRQKDKKGPEIRIFQAP